MVYKFKYYYYEEIKSNNLLLDSISTFVHEIHNCFDISKLDVFEKNNSS